MTQSKKIESLIAKFEQAIQFNKNVAAARKRVIKYQGLINTWQVNNTTPPNYWIEKKFQLEKELKGIQEIDVLSIEQKIQNLINNN